jgi:hypothetical protein
MRNEVSPDCRRARVLMLSLKDVQFGNRRNETVRSTTTLIAKLLTNPLALSRSTEDAGDQSAA